MKAVAFGLTSWTFGLVPKSELLHSPEAQDGFVPKHSLHGGKNTALRAEKPISVVRIFLVCEHSSSGNCTELISKLPIA